MKWQVIPYYMTCMLTLSTVNMSGGNKRVSMKLKLFFGLLATVLAAVAVVCFVTLEQPKSTGSVDTQATVSHKRSLESITQDKFTQEQEVLRVN